MTDQYPPAPGGWEDVPPGQPQDPTQAFPQQPGYPPQQPGYPPPPGAPQGYPPPAPGYPPQPQQGYGGGGYPPGDQWNQPGFAGGEPPKKGPNAGLIAGIAVAVLLAVGGIVLLATSGDDDPEEASEEVTDEETDDQTDEQTDATDDVTDFTDDDTGFSDFSEFTDDFTDLTDEFTDFSDPFSDFSDFGGDDFAEDTFLQAIELTPEADTGLDSAGYTSDEDRLSLGYEVCEFAASYGYSTFDDIDAATTDFEFLAGLTSAFPDVDEFSIGGVLGAAMAGGLC